MVVGEPSLMGGEFGDEDERLITRLENTQYDSTNSLDHDNHGGFGDTGGPNSWNVDSKKSITIQIQVMFYKRNRGYNYISF